MKKSNNNRRRFIQNVSAGLGALCLPRFSKAENNQQPQKKKIVCVGGHPDDPESGCGGSLARFSGADNDVTIIYLIPAKPVLKANRITKQQPYENRSR